MATAAGIVVKHGIRKYAWSVRWLAAAIAIGGVMVAVRMLPMDGVQHWLKQSIGSLGAWGPVAFAFLYAAATVCVLPGSIFSLAAGAIFGLWVGYLTVTAGSVTGAALAFLIARYAARSKVQRLAESHPKFAAIDEAISEGGWKIVVMLRLSPAIPFNLQNYLYGLTNIPFWHYLIASWIAMIPGTFLYVYLGHVAGMAALSKERTTGQWALLAVGLAATIAATAYITYLAKQKLKAKLDGHRAKNTPAPA